jgi:hypothetical protein
MRRRRKNGNCSCVALLNLQGLAYVKVKTSFFKMKLKYKNEVHV